MQRVGRGIVRHIYASHNSTPTIQRVLKRLLSELGSDARALNLGCGQERLDARIVNVDIGIDTAADVLADGHALPFAALSFALIVSQEALEHMSDPWRVMREVERVLAPGGILYLQLPFVIGYHPGPTDFWRFSREGISQLARGSGLEVVELGIAVGGGTGMYRIAVEFFACLAGVLGSDALYKIAKGSAAVLLYPLKWFDPVLEGSLGRDRIPGGYFVIARKPFTAPVTSEVP
jgi:SAM-dependent methyltransferase